MTDQERIAALCDLVDSCIDTIDSDSWAMEYDGQGEFEARQKMIGDYKQQLKELAPSHLHAKMFTLKEQSK